MNEIKAAIIGYYRMGATIPQISMITGHSELKITIWIDHYLNTKKH